MPEPQDIDVEAAAFMTAFGDEIRRAREGRGWSREELVAASGLTVAVSTVAAQELGVRDMSAFDLAQYCRALGIVSDTVFDTAYRRVLGSETYLYVDLAAVAHADAGPLRPLRAWARARTAGVPADANTTVLLTDDPLDDMARRCEVSRADLIHALLDVGAARFPPRRAEVPPCAAPVAGGVLESLREADVLARWPFLAPVVELPGPPWQFRLMPGGTLAGTRAHDNYADSLWVINEDVVGLNRTPIRRSAGRTVSGLDFAGSPDEVVEVLRQPVRWEDEP